MFIATRNFIHSGMPCKAGHEYKGPDTVFLLSEKLIKEIPDPVKRKKVFEKKPEKKVSKGKLKEV